MTTPIVRMAQQRDFSHWLTLWDGYNAFYGRSGTTALSTEITHTTWSRFFDACEPMQALVAEINDGVVGMAHVIFHRSTILTGPTCYLQDLFTAETARGRGVARALIDAVCAHAARLGCARVYWMTHESNATAMKLYDGVAEKSGFIVYRKFVDDA